MHFLYFYLVTTKFVALISLSMHAAVCLSVLTSFSFQTIPQIFTEML